MSTVEHPFRESGNPRNHGCSCGRPKADHPEPTTRLRVIDTEREITREAARGLVDPEALIQFAEARAASLSGEYVTDSLLVNTLRDRIREAREEAVDLRNHLVWWLEDSPDHPLAQRRFLALRHLCLLYDLLSEED